MYGRQPDAPRAHLPLVGVFVNLLRIPYAYLYPLIIMFCASACTK